MFILNIFKLIGILFLSYYVIKKHSFPLSMGDQLSDWILLILVYKKQIIISSTYLFFIFLLLNNPQKYIKSVFLNKHTSMFSWEKWKGFVIFLLIFDVYFYLFSEYKWFLVGPFAFYLLFRGIFKNKSPKRFVH